MSIYAESSKGKEHSHLIDVEEHLLHAQLGVRKLKQMVDKLDKENASLRDALQIKFLASQPSSATDDDTNLELLSVRDLEKEVENLKQSVSTIKKENNKLRKEKEDVRAYYHHRGSLISRKLQKGLLKEEVDALQSENATDEEIEPASRMRKLLRKFSDLMLVSTISGDTKEVCPLCYKRFILKQCSALGCGHLICHVCLPTISRAATRDTEALRCPLCRQDTPREELELVHMTEKGRWDKLTRVAQAWIAFDRRGELETSEEEDEENFITDGDGTSEATSEAENNDDQTVDEAPAQDVPADIKQEEAGQALLSTGASFSDSPTKLKRKRIIESDEE